MTAAVRSPAELLFDGIDMIKCMLMSEEDRGRTEAVRQAPPPVPFVIIPAGNDPCRLRTKRRRKRRRKKNPESPICEGGYQAASQDVEQLLGTLKEIYKGSNKSRSGRSRKRTWEEQQRNLLGLTKDADDDVLVEESTRQLRAYLSGETDEAPKSRLLELNMELM